MKSRFLIVAGGCLATLVWSTPTFAQGTDEFGAYGGLEERGHLDSPQKYAFELRFGPYRPNVDDSVSGSPYEDIFGNKNRYLLGVEVDWQAIRIPYFGTFGPGAGFGYTSISADAPFTNSAGRSSEKTRLKIMPMYVVGVLRVDVLARETVVPLAAYAKGGLGYGLWWAMGEDKIERSQGEVGKGASYGYNFALGGMLLLDALDRRGAVEMDSITGINNAYLFFEYYLSNLDGFGGDRMNVGTDTWMLGLALEF
jgi:hypothetical protein